MPLPRPSVSRAEFEAAYAKCSGMTISELHQRRVTLPCLCGDGACKGWQAVPQAFSVDAVQTIVRQLGGRHHDLDAWDDR